MIIAHGEAFHELLKLLNRLDAAHIYYRLRHTNEDRISMDVDVPGERWEIEFVDYGSEVHVEVEVFRSVGGVVLAGGCIEELFRTHGEHANAE